MINEQQDLSQIAKNLIESKRQDLNNRRKEIVDKIEKRKRRGKIISIKVPELANFKKCKVTKCNFKPGDIITIYDDICTIEYDKASLEIASEHNCRLITIPENDTIVYPGKELCTLESF